MIAGGNDANWLPDLALATLAVVLLQHAINLLNDASDWALGADTEKLDSWVRFHHQNIRVTLVHGWVSFLLGGLLGLTVLVLAGKLWILMVAAPLLILGFLYNSGPRPLSYTHLGEWVTGVCYGPGVFGCLWLLSGEDLDVRAIMGAIAFAALAVCLLLSHQPPQIETDRLAGKQSFAVRYGVRRTRQVIYVLFMVFLLSIGVALRAGDNNALVLPVYAGMSLLVLIYVSRQLPKPVTVLIPSTLLLLVTLLVGLM
jgi:1,4-dihydroxy-2-naphthoate octaprenyltransferase